MFTTNPLYQNEDHTAVRVASGISIVEAELKAAAADNPVLLQLPRSLTGTGNRMELSGDDALSVVQALRLPNGHALADGQAHTTVAPQTTYAAAPMSGLGPFTSPQQEGSAALTMHSVTCTDEDKPGALELTHAADQASADVARSTATTQQHLDDWQASMLVAPLPVDDTSW